MTESAYTNCPSPQISLSYRIDLDNNGGTDLNSSEDTITGPFPIGTHKVIWKATDFCGNQAQCTYLFTIKDCNPPNLICINGLTQNLDPPNCTETFQATQFILNLSDNCTPTNQLDIGIQRTGSGTTFPTTTSLDFDSCDAGIQFIEIWVRDGGGLINSCQGYVLVQNSTNSCTCNIDADLDFKGCAHSAGNQKLTNYMVHVDLERLDSLGSWTKQKTVADSCYSVALAKVPFGGDYKATVRAQRNDGPLVGFSTFDLALISKHILGIESFTSFYQIMAADMNNSQTVTTFDIVEGRKLLLGIYDTLPNQPSWRLIRPLANPSNLSQWAMVKDTYQLSYPNLLSDLVIPGLNFVGVKSGDVNMSAAAVHMEDRNNQPISLRYTDRFVAAGETISIPLFCDDNRVLQGWQMALNINPSLFRVLGLEGLAADDFHLRDDGSLRVLHFDAHDFAYRDTVPVFVLEVRALQNAYLSDALDMVENALRPEAYTAEGVVMPLMLRGEKEATNSSDAIHFFPPRPNPIDLNTHIALWSPEPVAAKLIILTASGQQVYQSTQALPSGYSQIGLDTTTLPEGILMYRLQAGHAVFTGKMLKLQP